LPQCRTASKYSVNKRTREETGNGEGFEIIESGEFEEDGIIGRYVHRVLHFKSRVPASLRWVIPDKYSHIHEHNRNAFPHYVATFRIPAMGDRMILDTETVHFPYKQGDQLPENPMHMTEDELKIRQIHYLDILNGPAPEKKKYDLHGYSCPEANIQELQGPTGKSNDLEVPEWVQYYNGPITLIVKTVKFKAKIPGAQTILEKYIANSVFYRVYLDTHRAMLIDAPEWAHFNEDDIKAMENHTQNELNAHEFDRDDEEGAPQANPAPKEDQPKEEKKSKHHSKKHKKSEKKEENEEAETPEE
jgi:hypothetical protein